MLKDIKLYFTNKPYYNQRKRYNKLQKKYRNKLKKLAKNFCPWSGYYMHEMIHTMLDFYYKTYLAGDCCWSDDTHRLNIANCIAKAIHYAEALEALDGQDDQELISEAKKDSAFNKYIESFERKTEKIITECTNSEMVLASLAYDYLEAKYTKIIYKVIGEHIWEWWD